MNDECEGSGRELPAGPPPAVATACPVCGRETKVEADESGGEARYTIARHDTVVKES